MKHIYIALLVLLGIQLGFSSERNNLVAPSATITGPSNVCQNATGQVITFTGSGGTRPYVFIYTVTGVAGNQTIQTVGSNNTVTLPIVTTTAGTFTYSLVSVEDSAAGHAPINVTGNVVVVISAPPIIDFTFTNDNTCSGTSIQFTSSVSGSGGATYSWDFGDGSALSSSVNPTHSFTSLGCGTGAFTVVMTVTRGGCTVTKSHTVTVKQKPDVDFVDTINPFDPFSNCSNAASNPIYTITVGIAPNPSPCVTSYSINWGDGNNQSAVAFPISHTYSTIGAYSMVVTALGSNGCSNVKTYIIKNVSNPLGGLNSPGSTQNLCAPTANLQFAISNWGSNSLDTTYVVNYGDSTPTLTLTQLQMNASSFYNAASPASSTNYPIPHVYATSSCPAASFEVKLDVTNACGTTPFTLGNISILTRPAANFTAPANACVNTSVLFTNTTQAGYGQNCVQSAIYTWNFGDGTPTITTPLSPPQNINHTFTTPGTYTVTLTSQNFCGLTSKTETICIEPPLTPLFTAPTTGCAPFTFTTTNNTSPVNQCSTPSYTWSVTFVPDACGTGIPTIPNQTTTNANYTFTQSGVYTIRLTASNSCTPAQFITQTVTVKKPPTVAITAIPPQCQNVSFIPTATINGCPDSSIIRYLWTFTGGTPVSAATAISPSVSYSTTGNYTISLEVENGCGTTTATSNSFAVQPAPTVQNEATSVCSGVPFSVTPSPGAAGNSIPLGTTYSWSALPIVTGGITGGAIGTNQTSISGTLTNPTNTAQTATYTVTPKFGNCTGAPFTVTVTVNPSPVVTFSPAPQTLCSGDTSAIVTLSSVAGATLNWTVIPPAGITGIALTSGTNTIPAQTLTNSTNAPITITYNASATTSGSSTCAGALYPYTIVVKPSPRVTENFTPTVCSASTFSVTPANSTLNTIPTGTTYTWTTPIVTGGMTGGAAGNAQTVISGTLINPTDIAQTATYSVTPTTNGCPGLPFTVTVTVDPKPSIANNTPPAICSGTSFTVTPSSGGSNIVPVGTTYTWTVSLNANITGQSASNASGITTISQTLTNTSNTNQVITYTVTPTSGSCVGSTFIITVTVIPEPTIANVIPAAICSGDSFTVTPTNGAGNVLPPGTTYTWGIPVSNPLGAVSGGSDQLTGVNNISQTLFNTTNSPAVLTYTVTPASGTCTGNPFTITITVNPTPTSLLTSNQLYCNGVPTSVIAFTNTVVGTTYSWTNSNTAIGLSASGNGNIPVFTPTNTTNAAITAIIAVTATANGCSRPAETFTITVNPAPTVIFSSAPQTLCSGDTSTLVTLSSSITGTTFNWIVIPPAGITGITTTTGTNTIPAETLINTTSNPITVTYDATASTASGSTCAGAIYSYTIIVNPIPSITETFVPITCSGTAFNIIPNTTLNAIPVGTTYSWIAPTVTGGMTGGIGQTAQTSITGTLINPTDSNQTAIYTVVPNYNGCSGTPFTVTLTVNPKPIIANVIAATICSGDTFVINPSTLGADSVPAGTAYTWTVAANPNLSGQSASSAAGITSISQTLTNNSNSNQTLIYTITPISGTCLGSDFTITITVNPKPTIANTSPPAICSGDTFTVIPVDGSGDTVPVGTTYTWTNPISNPAGAIIGGTAQVVGQNSISQTLTNTTNAIATITYTVTPISGTCVGAPFTIVVTLSPIPVISPQSTTICSTTTFTVRPTTTSGNIIPSGTTYTWTTPTINPLGAVTGGIAESTAQNSISQTLVNLTTSPATVTYTVTPKSGSCIGATFTVTVTVNPAINPNIVATNNRCFGVNIASITTNITGGIPFSSGTPYQLSWTGPGGYTSSATAITNLQPGTYAVTIIDAGGCPFSNSYTITEPTDIAITIDSENDITCNNAANGSINITVNGGTGAYTYTWKKGGNPYAITEDIANLSPGNYEISVTDANNCGPRTASFTITEPPQLVVNLVNQVNVLCFGASTGAITVNVIGGTVGTGYNFSWLGPNGFTSANQNLTRIPAGTYVLTVTDANLCTETLSVIITQSTDIAIAYATTPITCYGANNASLSVTLSGGNPTYTFVWSNLSTSLTQTNLSAGNYTITVTDNVGCIKTATIVIPQAPVFTVNPIVSNVSCYGANNGSINLNLTGGIAPVALTWGDGSTAGLIRNNLPPGVYSATISDGTPCYIQRTFTIIEPLPIVLSANLTNALNCTNASTGAIDLTVAGGTLPYTFTWSNGAVTEDVINLTSGNYLVTVIDANGCSGTAQYPIIRPAPIAITVTTQTDFDCAAHTVDQSFIAQVSGGVPPYLLQWSSGVISGVNNEIMHSNVNGTVILTVTDSNTCTANNTVTVDTPELGYPSFGTSSFGYTTYGLYAINDPIQFQSTITGDYISVSWDFGDGTFSTDLNPVHTYLIPKDYVVTQTVTYPFGCVYVQTITLIVEKGYVLVVPTAFTPNGDTLNETYRPVTKGLKNIVLDIYDTWGSLIYSETGDVLVGWDAKIKGFNAENGNYYSKVRAETFYGTVINSNQTFVLIK